jgi:hypothetical protein
MYQMRRDSSLSLVRLMDRDDLAKLCDARDTLCGFCENDECEKCIVTLLIDQAFNECDLEEDD